MKEAAISQVYAEALLELAAEKRELERVQEEATFLAKLLAEDPSLRVFVESPNIESHEKRKVLYSAFRGRVSDTFLNFVLLVIRKRRELHIRDMLEIFCKLCDDKMGIVHAKAITAVPLSAGLREALHAALQTKLRKKIALENVVDGEILGGLIVRYDGMVADGSLVSALRKLESRLRQIKFGSELVHEN